MAMCTEGAVHGERQLVADSDLDQGAGGAVHGHSRRDSSMSAQSAQSSAHSHVSAAEFHNNTANAK